MTTASKDDQERHAILGRTQGGQEPVTDQMLEAGLAVLRASGIADDYVEADKLVLAEIYRAMLRAQDAH